MFRELKLFHDLARLHSAAIGGSTILQDGVLKPILRIGIPNDQHLVGSAVGQHGVAFESVGHRE
jgi:hypothetical protein